MRIEHCKDGSLDEIAAENTNVHLEKLGKDHWFLQIGEIRIWFSSKKKIDVTMEQS